MTLDGQFHFFLLPAADISSTSIAAGPDGNLWFTENIDDTDATSQRIGRMTPAGAFTEFAVAAPFGHSYLRQIIAGLDGNLWFSLEGSDASYNALGAIGKITPQGAITIIPLGTYDTPEDMTVGPDHNIWFTTNFEVGRVTSDGHAQMFDPDPHAKQGYHIGLGGITSGPDGALWFATANVKVGRVTTSGSFSYYPLASTTYFDNGTSSLTLGDLKGIVTGADGALWLTDAGQIGQFV